MHRVGGMGQPRPARRWSAALAVALVLLSGPLTPVARPAAGAQAPQVDLAFEQYVLPNGLEVILHVDERLPIAAVNLWYHVGPANERPDRRGFAHLFEHLMFEGSGHVPEGQFDKLLEAAGSSNNASTAFDYTNYVIPTVAAEQLELALWLEADRMGFLLDAIDQQSLANQQAVARNERREAESAPYGLVWEELFHQLFPEDHPYHASVIGSHEDIQSATLEDIREFHRTYYVPNNATLAVAGNIHVAQTRQWIEQYFGTIPAGAPVPEMAVLTPPLGTEKRVTMTDEVERDMVSMAWLSPPAFAKGDADAVIAGKILGGSAASRFRRALVHDGRLAQSVDAYQYSLEYGSVFVAEAQAMPGRGAAELEGAMQAELDRLAREGPTPDEVSAAQASTTAALVKGLQTLGDFGGRADQLNLYNHYLGDPDGLDEDLARYAAVTPESVQRFVADVLRPDRRVVLHVTPGPKVLPPDPPAPDPPAEDPRHRPEPGEPWRNQVPGPGPERAATSPVVLQFELDNGMPVYFVEEHRLPVVTAAVVTRHGSAADPKGRPGVAQLTTDLLSQGTSAQDALAVAASAEALGTALETSTSRDQASITVQTLTADADGAVALLAESVRTPAFTKEDHQRLREEQRVALAQRAENAEDAAWNVTSRNLYGDGHPYAHPPTGTDGGVKRSSQGAVRRFWKKAYNPANAALVLAGDLTTGAARDLARAHFGDWKAGRAEAAPAPEAGRPASERVLIVDAPDAGQTALVAGQPGIRRADPEYETLQIMNVVLGGSFTSRLNTNLRETRGYTYFAGSHVLARRGAGLTAASTQVETSVTGASVAEILYEIEAMADSGVTDEELARAKAYRSGQASMNFASGQETATALAELFVHDLSLDYWQTLGPRIAPLTTRDVYDAARRHLRPGEVKIIAVGDTAQIEPQLAELNLGPIGYRSADGGPADE